MRNASAAGLFQYFADSCPSLTIQQEYFEQMSFPGGHHTGKQQTSLCKSFTKFFSKI